MEEAKEKDFGGRYNFTTEDEIVVPTNIGDIDKMEELIVAREGSY